MNPLTKQDIARRLKRLSVMMHNLGGDMDYYGGVSTWAKHGLELAGASRIVDEWAREIEKEAIGE